MKIIRNASWQLSLQTFKFSKEDKGEELKDELDEKAALIND
jgi:hypothetical protein